MSDPLAVAIGRNIRDLRKECGMTQCALGRAAGVSQGAVGWWERGEGITAVNLVSVADALGVTVNRLLGRDTGEEFWEGYTCGWDACQARMSEAAAPATAALAATSRVEVTA